MTWIQKPQTDILVRQKSNRHLYPSLPLSLPPHLPPTLLDISESNNAVNLIGHWCHNFEVTIHGGPRSFIVFHF